jgi:SecD/SecF fusion protein
VAPDDAGANSGARRELPGPNVLAVAGAGDFLLLAQAEPAPQPAAKTPVPNAPSPSTTPNAKPESRPAGRVSSRSNLEFGDRISQDAIRFQILDAARDAGVDVNADRIDLELDDTLGKKWTVELPLPPDQADKVLRQLQTDLANTPVFPSASKIGSKVAAHMQQTAVLAMVLSFFGIVVYLWIRFQRVAYGLAAIIATLHDILITLGILALTGFMAPFLGFLLIENFKINLSVIAAFMTLIGYSINDTIVIFDRIREVRGKSPRLTLAMVNSSVNQTLGRTILTGGTVLVSLLILYILGGQGIRGFAFTMLVGIIIGTYSSVYVGPPVLLWLAEGVKRIPETQPAGEKLATAPVERH